MSRFDAGSLPADFTEAQLERAKHFFIKNARYYSRLPALYAAIIDYARQSGPGFWEILDISPRPDREQVAEAYNRAGERATSRPPRRLQSSEPVQSGNIVFKYWAQILYFT